MLSNEVRAVLQRIRDGFATNPASWAKANMAYDANQYGVHPRDAGAVCWCLVGALRREINPYSDEYSAAKVAIQSRLNGEEIVVWNDHPGRTVDQVIAKLDEVLAA